MNPAQNRTGLASAPSHDSQDVTPAGRAAAQLDNSTLLPAPADPTTTVSRCPAPAVSRSCSPGRSTSVAGSVVGRNFARANRALRVTLFPAVTSSASACPTAGFRLSPATTVASQPDTETDRESLTSSQLRHCFTSRG
jgi:hypothetical protein